MECMIADTPCYRALLGCRRCLVSLAFYAKVHNVVAADGAVVDHDVPCPQGNSVPLLHFKARLLRRGLCCSWCSSCCGSSFHFRGITTLALGSHVQPCRSGCAEPPSSSLAPLCSVP